MKILYISYFYPPLGGPAVFRNTKVVKYLAEMGAEIDVISIKAIEYLYSDASLLAECGHRKLIRCDSWDLMALIRKLSNTGAIDSKALYMGTSERIKRLIRSALPIDDKIGWLPNLLFTGMKALKRDKYDFIYVSCGPFSSALGAYFLAKIAKIPYVIDYRDYWSLLDDYSIYLSPWHRALARFWEKKILAKAKLVISATAGIGTDLAAEFGSEIKAKIFTMYNGWDEADFVELEDQSPSQESCEIAYFGAMYARRTLKHFYRAIFDLRKESLLPPNVVIRLYGNYFVEAQREISESGISDLVEIVPQLSHREALKKMKNASLLLLVINSSSPQGTLTSKVFEYLRTQRPILAMIPSQNEAAQLLKACGHNFICAMESVSGIKACLQDFFANSHDPSKYIIPHQYERSQQIKALYSRLL